MSNLYGSDFITIVDEDGEEFELEVLSTVEFNGNTYHAVILASDDDDQLRDYEISILKIEEENGEEILCAIEDPQELEAVHQYIMEQLEQDEA